jgi:hypothetical protein
MALYVHELDISKMVLQIFPFWLSLIQFADICPICSNLTKKYDIIQENSEANFCSEFD